MQPLGCVGNTLRPVRYSVDGHSMSGRRNFSCLFLVTSVNGLVPFAPVSRANDVGVVELSESPVLIMHNLDRQGPNQILLLGQDLRFLCRVLLL